MGYESKLYVVNKGGLSEKVGRSHKEMRWAEVVASFDLCKVYAVSDKLKKYPATDCFFFEGNKRVIKDCYNEALREIPLADTIKIIEDAVSGKEYRRFAPCLGLLKGFNPKEWGDNLVVLLYGH